MSCWLWLPACLFNPKWFQILCGPFSKLDWFKTASFGVGRKEKKNPRTLAWEKRGWGGGEWDGNGGTMPDWDKTTVSLCGTARQGQRSPTKATDDVTAIWGCLLRHGWTSFHGTASKVEVWVKIPCQHPHRPLLSPLSHQHCALLTCKWFPLVSASLDGWRQWRWWGYNISEQIW